MLLFIIGPLLPFYKNDLLKGNQKFVLLKMIFVKTDTKLKWDLLPYKTLKKNLIEMFTVSLVWWFRLMVFNITLNNITVISWQSVLLVEEPEYQEKTIDLSQVTDKLYHIMLYTSPWSRFELTTSVVIGTDCTGSCKSNYHMITATTAHIWFE